jgi:hypothetical protein
MYIYKSVAATNNYIITVLTTLFCVYILLPAFQVQVLICTADAGLNPKRAHVDKFGYL